MGSAVLSEDTEHVQDFAQKAVMASDCGRSLQSLEPIYDTVGA